MNYLIARLLALTAMEMCTVQDFIKWALKELESRAMESSIAILAGLKESEESIKKREALKNQGWTAEKLLNHVCHVIKIKGILENAPILRYMAGSLLIQATKP